MNSRLSRLLEKMMRKLQLRTNQNSTPSKTASHNVPEATISVSNATATPGELVVIKGERFPGFSTISALAIGGVNALPVPAPATDVNGAISVTVMVPALSQGIQAAQVTIGGISASTNLTIVTAAVLAPKELVRPVMDSGGFDWLDAPKENVYSIEDGRAARWADPS